MMAIYVDPAIHPWKGKMWCHLTADTDDELHEFAARLGMRRSWFQNHALLPHYDITANKRLQAIQMGAIEIDVMEAGRRVTEARLKKRAELEKVRSIPP